MKYFAPLFTNINRAIEMLLCEADSLIPYRPEVMILTLLLSQSLVTSTGYRLLRKQLDSEGECRKLVISSYRHRNPATFPIAKANWMKNYLFVDIR